MNIIITGATGMIGKGVLLECLKDEKIEYILVLGRTSVGIKHPKLLEILQKDFEDYSDMKDQLSGFDACFYCLGISAAGKTEKEYSKITYDYTVALADELYVLNPGMTFTYVSGAGTDSSAKGSTMWARVKGRTENALLDRGFGQAYMFRPGIIIPRKGVKSKTKSYQFFYDYFMWVVKVIKFFAPKSVVDTVQMGQAMIQVSQTGYSKPILNPKDIIKLSKMS